MIWRTKTVPVASDVQDVLMSMDIERKDSAFYGHIKGQLDRKLYTATAEIIELMGGQWVRKEKAHVFIGDPRSQIEQIRETGKLVVVQDSFFQTPRKVVDAMLALVPIPADGLILEPSAGMGAIADALAETTNKERIFCVEANATRADILRRKGYLVFEQDFLEYNDVAYDRVYMNPPFEAGQTITHIQHAYELLVRGGTLVSVADEGVFFRSDKASTAFREWLNDVGAHDEKLPVGSFSESGTGVNARLVVISKD